MLLGRQPALFSRAFVLLHLFGHKQKLKFYASFLGIMHTMHSDAFSACIQEHRSALMKRNALPDLLSPVLCRQEICMQCERQATVNLVRGGRLERCAQELLKLFQVHVMQVKQVHCFYHLRNRFFGGDCCEGLQQLAYLTNRYKPAQTWL